jgi:hypothetical protein
MKITEMFTKPTSKQVTEFTQKVFGRSIDISKLDVAKRQQIRESVTATLARYDNVKGTKKHNEKEYFQLKLIKEAFDTFQEDDVEEGNEFIDARRQAIKAGKKEFTVGGKTYKVTGDTSQEMQSEDAVTEKEVPTKAEIDELEDRNQHGEVAEKLVKAFGTDFEIALVDLVNSMHEDRGHIMPEEQKARDAIISKYYNKISEEVNEKTIEYKPNPGKYSFYSTPEMNLTVQEFVQMVKKADADGYGSEVLYDAVYGRYGQQVENYVVELQNDISSEQGLHPKDDYEQIEQEAFEQILGEDVIVDEAEPGNTTHNIDFSKLDPADINAISEIVNDYIETNMPDEDSEYTYDIVIDIDEDQESTESVNESVQVNEGEMEKSELVLAAKSIVDKYDEMIKDVGELFNEDLQPLVDKIRDEMGSEIADQFQNAMGQAVDDSLDNLKSTRDATDAAQRILVGDTPDELPPMGDIGADTDDAEIEPIDDIEADPDDFGASDAAVGGDNPIGREKRS